MFGLITMLVSTLGATGMGSILKMVGGIVAASAEKKAAAEKRELARELAVSRANADLQKNLFGEPDKETAMFTRATRRFLAVIGMCTLSTITLLTTVYPSVPVLTTTNIDGEGRNSFLWGLVDLQAAQAHMAITTGHISLFAVTCIYPLIVGFYFTPGGRR